MEDNVVTLEKAKKALCSIKSDYEIENGRLEVITPDRHDEVYEIMANHFLPDEPMSRAFGVQWNEDIKQFCLETLNSNMSICMISNDTNQIMGVRLISVMKQSDPVDAYKDIQKEPFRELYKFLTHKDSEVNFLDRYGAKEGVHFFALGVHRKYRRMGLGGKLLGAAVAMSRELGFKVIRGEGTSNFSQRIYEKQGFEILYRMPYDSYMYKGQPIINGTGEHTMTKIYGLRL